MLYIDQLNVIMQNIYIKAHFRMHERKEPRNDHEQNSRRTSKVKNQRTYTRINNNLRKTSDYHNLSSN